MNADKIKKYITTEKIIGVIRSNDTDQAIDAGKAAFQGGLKIVEVACTSPNPAKIAEALQKDCPDLIVGAGSVLSQDQAKLMLDAGCKFFVSPHCDPWLLKDLLSKSYFYIPGGMTPSELALCASMKPPLIKLFPGEVVGAEGVKAILAPLPMLELIVTGGIHQTNVKSFFEAGAKAVCVGSAIFSRNALEDREWAKIEKSARSWVEILK